MKRTMHSLVVAAGFASMIALGGGLAYASDAPAASTKTQDDGARFDGCHMEKGHRGVHFLKRLAKKLNLTDQQVAQIKASFKNRQTTVKPLLANLRTERRQLADLVHSGNADEAAIRAQSARVAAVQADLAVQRAQGVKEMRGILTPEQQAKFQTLRGEWEPKMKKHHHHGGPESF